MDHRPKCKMQNYKTWEDNTEENVGGPWVWQWVFSYKTKSMMNERNNLGFIKMENFCSAKDSVKRMKRQATDW